MIKTRDTSDCCLEFVVVGFFLRANQMHLSDRYNRMHRHGNVIFAAIISMTSLPNGSLIANKTVTIVLLDCICIIDIGKREGQKTTLKAAYAILNQFDEFSFYLLLLQFHLFSSHSLFTLLLRGCALTLIRFDKFFFSRSLSLFICCSRVYATVVVVCLHLVTLFFFASSSSYLLSSQM